MRNQLFLLIMIFTIIESQEYNIQLIYENHQKNYNNSDKFNMVLCNENIICNKIMMIVYYWFSIYIITIIIRVIVILFVFILCFIND
jgi:uncharacterized membrane protein